MLREDTTTMDEKTLLGKYAFWQDIFNSDEIAIESDIHIKIYNIRSRSGYVSCGGCGGCGNCSSCCPSH